MFLEPQDPAEFGHYIEELENILNDVHKKVELLPDIPYHDQILFREDDEVELEFSLTAENAKKMQK